MQFSQEIYNWLVSKNIIPNIGEQDEIGNVTLPINVSNNFDNGFLIAELLKKIIPPHKKTSESLSSIKLDHSKKGRVTNWNFLWISLGEMDFKMDIRIKQLILQGEKALIVQLIRQLYQRDESKDSTIKINIKKKSSQQIVKKNIQLDVKKINLTKNPNDSETSLQLLVILLNSSLGMSVQEILGLFTNQNKFLSQVIVKGINFNFDQIILFYTLLNKHSQKLQTFGEQDLNACLLALKSGFISKDEKVAKLAVELFSKFKNIYEWFVSEDSNCLLIFFLGLKRHSAIRSTFWELLLQIIDGEQLNFFSKHFPSCFQNYIQRVQITTYLIKFISLSPFCQELIRVGIVSVWLEEASQLPDKNIDAQIIGFQFIGEVMFYLPQVIQQNDGSCFILQREWYMRTCPQFIMLFNEILLILEKLAQGKSTMARKIYLIVTQIAKKVGPNDKRDYLVENFLSFISKFPTIPSQYLINNLKGSSLSSSQFLLICETIQINESFSTLISIGNYLKQMFLENPLVNCYLPTVLRQIIEKVIKDQSAGIPFFNKLFEDVINLYANLQIKYKNRAKKELVYFGKKVPKGDKQEDEELIIKQKWKSITLQFVMALISFVFQSTDISNIRQLMKLKVLDICAYIRNNNHKIGSKTLQDILDKKFLISKQQQTHYFEQYSKKAAQDLSESMIPKINVENKSILRSRVKGPEDLTRQLLKIAQKRKDEQQQRKILEQQRKIHEQKKKTNVKKQLQITNLLRGQIGQAQIRQFQLLQRLKQQSKQLEAIPLSCLEDIEIDSIECILKKYQKVLRHLFLTYTWTAYSVHSNQKFEDNRQRKECLNTGELGRMLKDYRLIFLTNQQQINNLVREINFKILNKRQVNELDFQGFEQFIIQFCLLIMTRDHNINITSNGKQTNKQNKLKNQPIRIILNQFFYYLKEVFIAKKEKTFIFEDAAQLNLSKEQASEIEDYQKKIANRPSYILPKGYKKISYNTVDFLYKFGSNIKISQSYLTVVQIIDDLLSQGPFNTHIIQSIGEKKIAYRVRPTNLGNPIQIKQRANSVYLQRKQPILALDKNPQKRRSSSKGIIEGLQKLPLSERKIGKQASQVLENIIQKLQISQSKQTAKQNRIKSLLKLQELEKSKHQFIQKKSKEKQIAKLAALEKEKQQEKKRRELTQKYLQHQKIKISEKKKKEEQERMNKILQQERKQALKKQNKQKFKVFHEGQVSKIKKIELNALQKIRKEKQRQQLQKIDSQQQNKKLREVITQQDKRIIEQRKQCEKNIRILQESQPIKNIFNKFSGNLNALFNFLIQNTYLSLTQKKHNNEIVFDTWRHFLSSFQLSLFVLPKDTTFIFKSLTKGKLVTKEYLLGLNFKDFQLALLRIAIKYKTIFNLISQRIKDKLDTSQVHEQADSFQKNEPEKKGLIKEKQQNEFDETEVNIKEILKQNIQSKNSADEYGDPSLVTDKTLLGLIYYLKVPNSKQGQEKRFRQILTMQNPSFAHQNEKLKEKLKQQYSLESKKSNSKTSSKNMSVSDKIAIQ